jgi:hypothetical protein
MKIKFWLLIFSAFITILNVNGQPVSSFTVDRFNICSGTTVSLNNTSTAANTYEWLIEGIHYSYSRDTIAKLLESCYDIQEIKLRAGDTLTGLYDSSTILVEVFDTCFFHWTSDNIRCPGDTIELGIFNEEIATQFTINTSYTLLNGCLTCPSIKLILTQPGTLIDRKGTYLGGCTEITSYHYLCTTDIDDDLENAHVALYPNPVSDKFNVESKNLINSVSIYNQLGEILLSKKINGLIAEVGISSFSDGFYFLQIQLPNGNLINRKFLKSSH